MKKLRLVWPTEFFFVPPSTVSPLLEKNFFAFLNVPHRNLGSLGDFRSDNRAFSKCIVYSSLLNIELVLT